MVNLSCIIMTGLAGVLTITLVYYFVTEWNSE